MMLFVLPGNSADPGINQTAPGLGTSRIRAHGYGPCLLTTLSYCATGSTFGTCQLPGVGPHA